MSTDTDRSDGILHLGQDEKRRVGRLAGRIKSITEFLSDAVEKAKDLPFADAITQAAPWVETYGTVAAEVVGDVVPPIKFLLKVCEKITEINDPEELGHLACTIAFERAAERAIRTFSGVVEEKRAIREAKDQLALMEPSEEVDLGTFTYENALGHEFYRKAEVQLQSVLIIMGYNEAQVDQISNTVKDSFVLCLKGLLTHRATREKFAPFREFIELGGAEEKTAYKAFAEHLKYQRWLFEEAPVLRKSPFALQHVYVNTDCGSLTWGDIHPEDYYVGGRGALEEQSAEPRSMDPFSEQNGGRSPLLQTVMALVARAGNREPIIIQGVAGAGKSSFTLRLCIELQRRQLRPVLIRFKDIRFDRHVTESLPSAVRLSDEQRTPGAVMPTPRNLFRGGNIFRESGSGEYSHICRYVLILDGWDEISVANEGFKRRVEKILEQIRSEYVDNMGLPLPVRIIMTGRPSADVNESGFLRDSTPILTIRSLTPPQLKGFVRDLSEAVRTKPLALSGENIWPDEIDLGRFESIFRRYEEEFTNQRGRQVMLRDDSLRGGSLGVLGMPLLAQLAARLISSWRGEPEQLIDNPTTLYRNLVNLTCKKAGKDEADSEEVSEVKAQSRIIGNRLRKLLWETASAMSIYGNDLIPYEELLARLNKEEDELDEEVSEATQEHTLSALLISFYFKGGFKHTGCEFVHKSFREYLYAEALVEALKNYGRETQAEQPEREPYWKDFAEDDPRFGLSRELAMLFTQWLSADVIFHLDHLIEWETRRAADRTVTGEAGTTTLQLDLRGWELVRDALADLWDWWGEGTHLRPQVLKNRRRELEYKEPFVSKLIRNVLPVEVNPGRIRTPRTTALDAHVGYGLFTLSMLVHHHLLSASAESVTASGPGERDDVGRSLIRRYQSAVVGGAVEKVRFAPSGPRPEYFQNYVHRIASAGLRPNGWFPSEIDMRSVDLRNAYLTGVAFYNANLSYADLRGAKLYRVNLERASLAGADLRHTDVDNAYLIGVNFSGADLSNADLSKSDLTATNCNGANFSGARLYGAKFHEANLSGADLRGAKFAGAIIEYTRLDGANLDGTDFSDVNLSQCHLSRSQMVNAIINDRTILPTEWYEDEAEGGAHK
jgi:uncharacterized protein YjbI with pentapeptide repeats